MTLIITVVDRDKLVQVSDRRLTNRNREVFTDYTNKAVCVGMDHVHFAASYTGLAFIGRETTENRTDYWLLDHLGAIARDGAPSVERICRSLGDRAGRALSRLRGDFKPLGVVLVGYDHKNRSFRATVSNMKVNEGGFVEVVRDHFVSDVRWFYPWSPKPEVYVAGAVPVFEAKDPKARALKASREKVLQYIKANREKLTEQQVAEALVWLTRAAHTHDDFGYLIGRDCLSVVAFPREPRRRGLLSYTVEYPAKPNKDTLFTSFYHPIAASSVFYAPHLADWYMDSMNVEADMDPELPEGTDPSPPDDRPFRERIGTNFSSRVRIKIHNLPSPPPEEG